MRVGRPSWQPNSALSTLAPMDTYLLTWNPDKTSWGRQGIEADIEILRRRGSVDGGWSCGTTKQIPRGSRVFLLQQGTRDRGLVGSGLITREPKLGRHWANRHRKAMYVGVRWDHLAVEPLIERDELDRRPLRAGIWNTRRSGVRVPSAVASALEAAWRTRTSAGPVAPDEVLPGLQYREGAVREVTVNAYERSPRAKAACLAHHGRACCVCRMTFERVYGADFEGMIHVHHLRPLSTGRQPRRVDPVKDLRPVCPNCHTALHRKSPPYTPAELKRLLHR